MPIAASMASRWQPNCPASTNNRFVCMNVEGLLTPARSAGGTRRYSADDLARLQRISELVAAGVNLAGIARILELEDRNDLLDDRNVALEMTTLRCRSPKPAANQQNDEYAPDTDPGLPRPAPECLALTRISCSRRRQLSLAGALPDIVSGLALHLALRPGLLAWRWRHPAQLPSRGASPGRVEC